MLDIITYFGIFWQAAIIIGFACVLGSTAWGIVETKHRKNKEYF
jgi:hypothetical protein